MHSGSFRVGKVGINPHIDGHFVNLVDFNLDGLLRGDTSARSNYYHNAILDGYLSRNEVRALEGFERVDGLDDMLYPLNTGVVGKSNEQDNTDSNG